MVLIDRMKFFVSGYNGYCMGYTNPHVEHSENWYAWQAGFDQASEDEKEQGEMVVSLKEADGKEVQS